MTIYQVNHITDSGEEIPLRRFASLEEAQRFINAHNNNPWGYYMLTLTVREDEDYEGTGIY